MQVPKETEPGVRRSKRPLSACHTRCKCSMETTQNSVKGRVRYKVWSVGVVIVYGQVTECQTTFVRGKHHIVWLNPRIDHKTSSIKIASVPWRIPVREAYLKVASWNIKRDFYKDLYTLLKPHLINSMDHMRVSGTEPSSVVLSQRSNFKSWKEMSQTCQNKLKPKGMV